VGPPPRNDTYRNQHSLESKTMRVPLRLLGAIALGLPAISLAGVDDYVRTPAVEYGEKEIDLKYGTAKLKDDEGRLSAGSLGFGWGATPWWFTEAYLKWHKEPGDKTKYDAWEWENKLQITETNKYFADVALFVEIEVPRERNEGYELAFGPLFQFYTGDLQWNINPVFERVFHSNDGESRSTELGYQLQLKHPIRGNDFAIGAQAFGELGKWNDWEPRDEQSHRAGPAIFGKVKLGGREQIKYNAAWLFGANAAARNTFRLQAEYEF
jgi:hypothetical protein